MKTKIDIERNGDTYKISVRNGDEKPTKVETSDRIFARSTIVGIMDGVRRDFFTNPLDVESADKSTIGYPDDVNPKDDPAEVTDKPEVDCYICGKPVSFMVARSGAGGRPCHGECMINKSKKGVNR